MIVAPSMNPATSQKRGPCKEAGARADAASAPADTWPAFVEVARRHLARAFREPASTRPKLDARMLVGHALGLDHAALVGAGGPRARAGRGRRHRRAGCAPARARAGGAHPRQQGVLGPAVRAQCRDAGAPAGDRDRGRGGARGAGRRRHRTAIRCASPISAPARARCCWRCSPNCRPLAAIGTDISLAALACARDNAAALGLADACGIRGLRLRRGARGDRSISWSPTRPMSRAREIAGLQPEVRDFDPRRALDGGPDGLDGYRAIAARRAAAAGAGRQSGRWNSARGRRPPWPRFLSRPGLAPQAIRHDLSGIARASFGAQRHESSTFQLRKKALGLWAKTD